MIPLSPWFAYVRSSHFDRPPPPPRPLSANVIIECPLVTYDIDILMISETKIDESFPLSQFMIDGFSMPYRCDRNSHGGGILHSGIVHFRNNITAVKNG